MPLAVSYSSAILEHGTEISSKQLVMLRWDSSRIMCIKHVKVAGKQACIPEPVCSNSCCGRFQVSFPKQPSNLIACNNSVCMVFQQNFYLLCVVCLQRLKKENSGVCTSWVLCGGRQGKQCAPRCPEHSLSPRYSSNENSDHQVSE